MTYINPTFTYGTSAATGPDAAGSAERTRAPGLTDTTPPTQSSGILEADLPDLPLAMRGISIDNLLQAVSNEARRAGVAAAVDTIETQGDQIRAENERRLEELRQQIEEQKKQSFWDKFLKAFKIIGAIVGAIAAVATTVVGAVTGNPLLIGAGIAAGVLAIDSTVSLATDGKVSLAAGFAELGKAMGMDEKAQSIFSGIMMLVTTLATIALSFGGAAASGAAKAAQGAAELSANAAKAMSGLSKISTAANVGTGVTQVGSGVGGAALAVIEHRIANIKADMVDIDAVLEMLRAQQAMAQDFVEAEMEALQNLMSDVKSIVEDCSAAATALLTNAPASV